METTENPKYTGSGQGNLNTVLGSIGTAAAFGILGPNGIGIGGGNREPPVSQRELDTRLNCERQLTEKDSEIGRLKAEKYADAAALAAERRLADKIEKIETTMTTGFAKQSEYNAVNNAVVAGIQSQTAQLMKMTNLIIAAPAFAESQAAASAFTAKTAAQASSGN